MAKLTPAEFQEKHARRLKASTEDIRNGIMRVTESPMEAAAKKKDKMRANINTALDNGKWEKGLKRVSLSDWKSKAADVGVGRISAGIDAAASKVTSFAAELLPHIDNVKSQVDKMPSTTLEDNINRMTTFVRGMAKFQRKG
jgi:hypothetical protein